MAELLSDAGYSTACFGKWHLGDVEGRIPTDQGFDEWWGISESSDEADYTSHPMYPPEFKRPKIKASVKGQPFEEIDDFNRETRPFMDENITEKTVDFIRRSAADDKPFFIYAPFTNVHPQTIPHPDFEDATNSNMLVPKTIAELDYRAARSWTHSMSLAWPRARSLSGPATTPPERCLVKRWETVGTGAAFSAAVGKDRFALRR